MQPKKIPPELLFELICFIPFHKKWVKFRISAAFSKFLRERHGAMLKFLKQLMLNCVATISQLILSILEIRPDIPGFSLGVQVPRRSEEAERLYTSLRAHAAMCQNFPDFPHLQDLNLDVNSEDYLAQLLGHSRELVYDCVNSPNATVQDIKTLGLLISVRETDLTTHFQIGFDVSDESL